jgi:hypothetical protein
MIPVVKGAVLFLTFASTATAFARITDRPVFMLQQQHQRPRQLTLMNLSRRSLIHTSSGSLLSLLITSSSSKPAFAKDLKEDYRQGTAALANMDDQAPAPSSAYKTLPSGVIYADLFTGGDTAATVKEGSRVNLQWVLRKSNGYFVIVVRTTRRLSLPLVTRRL